METAGTGAMLWSFGIHHLWEATVFAGLVGLVLWTWRRAPGRVRHAFLLLASVKFLFPSALLGLLAVRLEVAGRLVRGFHQILPEPLNAWLPAAAGGPEDLGATPSATWLAVLAMVWLAGSISFFGRWGRQRRALRALVAGGRPVEGLVARRLKVLQDRTGLRRRVEVVASEDIREPAVWGVFRPVLLLPRGVEEHLTDEELDAVLLHELVHVRRWDNLVATGVRVLCCLFWFHPMTWWLERRLVVERERVVDEQVVSLGGGSKTYARGLLKVVRFGLELQPAGVSSAGAGRLAERIDRILSSPGSRSSGWVQRGLWMTGAAGLLLFSLLPLPRSVCPTRLAEPDASRFVHAVSESPSAPAPTLRESPKSDCTG